MSKLKIELEGWHCLSKKDMKTILESARLKFLNANFIDNSGLLIENEDELSVFAFCIQVIQEYKNCFGSWDGYTVRRISKRIVFNYQDKKRKLAFEYFKKLVTESKFEDFKIVLAGILYLDPNELKIMLNNIQIEVDSNFSKMSDEQLKISYNLLIKYASLSVRTFSMEKNNGN